MLDSFYVRAFGIFVFLVKKTPRFISDTFLNILAKLAYLLDKRHKKIAKVNLDLAYGNKMRDSEKRKIIKKCYKNLLFNMRDFVENQNTTKDKFLSKIKIHNEYYYTNVKEKGKGVIFITAHYGNWELLPLFMGAKYGEVWGVGRALEHKQMNKILKTNREQFNVHLLDKKGALKGLLRALKKGCNVGLLVDQNTSEKEGVLIDFFGKLARHTPSAAIIARKMEVPIVPVFVTTKDYENFDITFYEPIYAKKTQDSEQDIKECVQAQARITEEVIRKKPDEWFWLHRRWKNQYEELYR